MIIPVRFFVFAIPIFPKTKNEAIFALGTDCSAFSYILNFSEAARSDFHLGGCELPIEKAMMYYSVLKASTGSFLAANIAGKSPPKSVSKTLIVTSKIA